MFSSLFLPKPRQRSCQHLILYKVCASFSLLGLTLLPAPNPAYAGQWEAVPSGTQTTTDTKNGATVTNTYPYTDGGHGPRPLPYYLSTIGGNAPTSNFPMPASEDTTTNVTITLTWVPDPGMTLATDPPPTAPVILNEFQYAAWNATASLNYGASTTGLSIGDSTSSDGYGDAQTFDIYNPASFWGYSSGNHLIQVDGSSGTITLTPGMMHMYAMMDCSGLPPQEGSPSATAATYLEISIAPDNRAVTISSSLGQTHHRLAGSPTTSVANVPGSDGTINADTLTPDNNGIANLITYTANYTGNWGASSSYKWFSSMIQDGEAGSFSSGTTLDTEYSYFNPPASPGQTEHVYVHLTDSSDGANATANYYLKFHAKYEDWAEHTSQRVTHPATYVQGGTNAEYTFIGEYDNDTAVDQKPAQSLEWSTQKTESGTIGSSVVSQATDPAGYIQFSANEAITSSTQKTITYKLDPGVTVPAHTGIRVYVGPVSTDLFGTCSVWDEHGYVGSGDTNWFGTQVPGSYSIAYEPYQRL